MRTTIIWFFSFYQVNVCLKLRSRDILDSFDSSGSSGGSSYTYTPTNLNTKAPKSFDDQVEPDTAYQEPVPALQALMDMTTTTTPKPPRGLR
jgi:hypothetical protein